MSSQSSQYDAGFKDGLTDIATAWDTTFKVGQCFHSLPDCDARSGEFLPIDDKSEAWNAGRRAGLKAALTFIHAHVTGNLEADLAVLLGEARRTPSVELDREIAALVRTIKDVRPAP